MATTGKSKRPPPLRDARAEPVASADDLGALLSRVAEAERARDRAVKRAAGLEAWTIELEAKVAEARTRADELQAAVTAGRSAHEATRQELLSSRARVAALEAEVVTMRREHDDALEVERVTRGLEIDALKAQQRSSAGAGTTRGEPAGAPDSALLSAASKAAVLLESLARQEASASAARVRMMEDARRLLVVGAETGPPAAMEARPAAVTLPPARPAKKRSRRPPAPTSPPAGATSPNEADLVTFEDLDLGD